MNGLDYLIKPDQPVALESIPDAIPIKDAEISSSLSAPVPSQPDIKIPLINNVPVLVESKEINDLKISGMLSIAIVALALFLFYKGKK